MKAAQQKVLVTGASGFIGRVICPSLESKGVVIRAFDRSLCDVVGDVVRGDLSDLPLLRRAASGIDTIINFAACSHAAAFITHLVPSHVLGRANALEATRREAVCRFIFERNCQASDRAAKSQTIPVNDQHPTDLYGLTRLRSEVMGAMRSRRREILVIAARLGWLVRDKLEFAELSCLSYGARLSLGRRDLRDFFYRAVTATSEGFGILHSTSRRLSDGFFGMEKTRRVLGFAPRQFFPEGAFE